mmetsp:Transcript_20328/g.25131  ORF Transcript_20328/g.25131 Transcript_20328/m.25131 type:complete len:227 (+) Transcript_20328:110-790(+)
MTHYDYLTLTIGCIIPFSISSIFSFLEPYHTVPIGHLFGKRSDGMNEPFNLINTNIKRFVYPQSLAPIHQLHNHYIPIPLQQPLQLRLGALHSHNPKPINPERKIPHNQLLRALHIQRQVINYPRHPKLIKRARQRHREPHLRWILTPRPIMRVPRIRGIIHIFTHDTAVLLVRQAHFHFLTVTLSPDESTGDGTAAGRGEAVPVHGIRFDAETAPSFFFEVDGVG